MRLLDNFIRKHCCFGQGTKEGKSLVAARQSILSSFREGSSVAGCIRNHPTLEVVSARIGNKSAVIFDRNYSPENFAVETRDRLSMYYDKYTLEAQAVVYEWEDKNG